MRIPDDPQPDHPAPLLPYDPAVRAQALRDLAFWRDTAVRLYAEIHCLQLPLRREQITQKLLAQRGVREA